MLKGRIALARRGIDFAMEQISSGVSVFKKVLNENIADIPELLSNCEDDENVHQVDQNEDSGEEDNGDDDVLNSCPVDSIIPRTLNGEPLPYVNSKIDCHGSNVWLFPLEFSQGCVDGRNGSNACSLIALIIGQAVLAKMLKFLLKDTFLHFGLQCSTILWLLAITYTTAIGPVYLPVTSLQQRPVTFWPEMVIFCWSPTNHCQFALRMSIG